MRLCPCSPFVLSVPLDVPQVCCDALACDPAVAATLAAAVAADDLTLLVSGVRDAWRQRRATTAELGRLRARSVSRTRSMVNCPKQTTCLGI